MRKHHPAGRKKKHPVRSVLILVLLLAVGCGAYAYLKPYLTADSIAHYECYTVQRGSISTTKSFSATLAVSESETFYNSTGADSIRKLYVTGGQEVQEGDTLMELSDGTILKAGITGVVNELRYNEGDWLRNNMQLAEICDLTHLKVSLQIDEYDIEQISAGQPCTVTVVPLNQSFETQLTHVSRLSSATGRVAYYSATADLTVPESVLPGMTASVSIPDNSVQDVLTLDMAALSFDENGQCYVLQKSAKGYQQVMVETGLSDGMTVEIISGLNEGDVVWVQRGTETVELFSLASLYQAVFGQTVIINEPRDNARGSMKDQNGLAMDFTLPSDMADMTDFSPPSDMSGFTDPATMTDFTPPSDMTWPDGAQQPQNPMENQDEHTASRTDLSEQNKPDNRSGENKQQRSPRE